MLKIRDKNDRHSSQGEYIQGLTRMPTHLQSPSKPRPPSMIELNIAPQVEGLCFINRDLVREESRDRQLLVRPSLRCSASSAAFIQIQTKLKQRQQPLPGGQRQNLVIIDGGIET